MCSQDSPPVEDTLCVTFSAKLLIESCYQTQQYGYINFYCSLSQSHLPETDVALTHQEYSHTFIEWRQICASFTEWGMIVFVDCSWSLLASLGTGCHKWLNYLLVRVLIWVAVLHQVLCFHNHMAKNDHLGSFYGFKSKRLLRMNLMHRNTDSISHVPIWTWPSVTSSHTSHGPVNDITQHFFLNSFLVLSFDTKMPHLKRRRKVLRVNQCYGNLPFISISVSFRNTVSLKTFSWIFPHPNFMTNTITFDVSNDVIVRFVHRVRFSSTSRISIFVVISGSTISPSSVAKLFLVSVYIYFWLSVLSDIIPAKPVFYTLSINRFPTDRICASPSPNG